MVPTPVILANCTAEREVISRHKLIVCLSHVAGDGNELHSSQTDAFFRLPSNTPAERRARTHEHFRIFTLSGRSVALLREGRRDAGRGDHFELSRVRYPVPLHLRKSPTKKEMSDCLSKSIAPNGRVARQRRIAQRSRATKSQWRSISKSIVTEEEEGGTACRTKWS